METIMTKTTDDRNSLPRTGPIGLRDAVDRWGHDLSKWPDPALAGHGREALLADRSFRAYRDGAGAMHLRLQAASAALDERIADGGSMERLAAAVMAKAAPRVKSRLGPRRLAGMAAIVLFAGILGSASELLAVQKDEVRLTEIVQLDPIVFGPSEMGF